MKAGSGRRWWPLGWWPRRAVAVWLVARVALVAAPAQVATVREEIAALERTGVRVGVAAVRLPSGDLLVHHAAREVFLPASNQKLLALAAVLHGLGPAHEFVTRFHLRGGALVVETSGDPNWTTGGAHDPRAILAEVAASLRGRGVDAVRAVELDTTRFPGGPRPAEWRIYDSALEYCPPTGALVLDAGCFEALLTTPAGASAADIAIVAPPAAFRVDGSIALTSDRKKGAVYGLAARGEAIRAWGALWSKVEERRVRGAFPDADSVTVRALQTCLERAGVAVRGDAAPADAECVHEHRSPLTLALLPMLHESSNFHAEQVVRALGAAKRGDGSCTGGSVAMAEELRAMVGEWPDVVLDDAAGLSRKNRVSPAFLVTVLAACAQEPWSAVYHDSLATGGEGTLEKRFLEAGFSVRAKTGTLRDASTLSGYLDTDTGTVAFVIFVNLRRGGKVAHAQWRRAQDRIVRAIAEAG
ncbi:MAG: D-alanyl-D-alanine carboxypeptidase/D-alanyl-D-alanine-endopeptidase [Planctomycetota bacterium]